ncbi:MAG TPA: SdrD B-like domain-containing protein [Methylomirabilota bacterium]|nr:SdrD B-like domain-containing protein [Methylomirabilota bacterium]
MKTCFHSTVAALLAAVTLLPAQCVVAQDAGTPPTGRLGDRVWFDADRDGLQDEDEPGMAGVVVELQDCDGNVLDTAITSATGHFLFEDLPAGAYCLRVVRPVGYAFTEKHVGGAGELDSDVNALGGTSCYQFVTPPDDLSLDAGLVLLCSISGHAWYDRNGNGYREPKDAFLAGVVVNLLACDGTVLAEAITGPDGRYRFDDLEPGAYQIGMVPMRGLALTRARIGAETRDSDVWPASARSDCVVLGFGQPHAELHVGIRSGYGCISFTQEDWGALPGESHPAALLTNCFARFYKRGLRIGIGHGLTFTSAQAVQDFLPAAGAPGVLVGDQTDPLISEAGELAGNLLALKLNVDFALRKQTGRNILGLKIEPGHPLAGQRVARLLALAHKVVGGRMDVLPPGVSLEDLNDTLARINRNFRCGEHDLGFLGR